MINCRLSANHQHGTSPLQVPTRALDEKKKKTVACMTSQLNQALKQRETTVRHHIKLSIWSCMPNKSGWRHEKFELHVYAHSRTKTCCIFMYRIRVLDLNTFQDLCVYTVLLLHVSIYMTYACWRGIRDVHVCNSMSNGCSFVGWAPKKENTNSFIQAWRQIVQHQLLNWPVQCKNIV